MKKNIYNELRIHHAFYLTQSLSDSSIDSPLNQSDILNDTHPGDIHHLSLDHPYVSKSFHGIDYSNTSYTATDTETDTETDTYDSYGSSEYDSEIEDPVSSGYDSDRDDSEYDDMFNEINKDRINVSFRMRFIKTFKELLEKVRSKALFKKKGDQKVEIRIFGINFVDS